MKCCEEVRELLSFYLDNELHENDRKRVVKHLESCDTCKASLNQLKNMVEAIGEIEEVDLPVNFSQKLHEKLVEVHGKSDLMEWVGKGKIFKWASTMVAGFVLLFAVVNSSYFSQLTQNSKTAYVSDTHLDTVDKQAMENVAQNQEVAEETTQQKSIESIIQSKDTITQSKGSVNNKSKVIVPTTTDFFENGEQKKDDMTPQDNEVTLRDSNSTVNADNNMKLIEPPKTSSMILTVNDVSGAVARLNDILKVNGGNVQEPQVFGLMSMDGATETKDVTLQIPVSSYSEVMDSIKKIGYIQTQPEIQSNSVQMKSAFPQAPQNITETDIVTVKISIQKEQ